MFWGMFPWNIPAGPGRVRTAVFPRTAEQRAAAEASKRRLLRLSGERVYTEILPGASFWPAERLHQKFNLQRVHPELVRELAGASTGVDAFLASTAAARLNSWVSGLADDAVLEEAAREVGWEVETLRRRLEGSAPASRRGQPRSSP